MVVHTGRGDVHSLGAGHSPLLFPDSLYYDRDGLKWAPGATG